MALAKERGVEAARAIIALLLGSPSERPCRVRYWDGSEDLPGLGRRTMFTLIIRSPGALRRMLLPPSELRLGEAYIRGDVDVEGDLESAAAMGSYLR
jgi:cyclopropane-fatty-acyl-phospholipid synthase